MPATSGPPAPAPDALGAAGLPGFGAAWLRANCPCQRCRDPASAQRLVSLTDLPAGGSITPWRPPGPAAGDPAAGDPAAGAEALYAACRAFTEILARPALMLTFRLEPGDCMVFDNTRVLHARTGFAATGSRHLQGCYADLGGVSSALAVLRREADHDR